MGLADEASVTRHANPLDLCQCERCLAAFRDFLSDSYHLPDDFFGAVATFVDWAKQKLRDPVAHGQGIELGWDELKQLREQLLFAFAGGEGFLKTLLAAMPAEGK